MHCHCHCIEGRLRSLLAELPPGDNGGPAWPGRLWGNRIEPDTRLRSWLPAQDAAAGRAAPFSGGTGGGQAPGSLGFQTPAPAGPGGLLRRLRRVGVRNAAPSPSTASTASSTATPPQAGTGLQNQIGHTYAARRPAAAVRCRLGGRGPGYASLHARAVRAPSDPHPLAPSLTARAPGMCRALRPS